MLEVSEFVKRRNDRRESKMGHVVVLLMGGVSKMKLEKEIWYW